MATPLEMEIAIHYAVHADQYSKINSNIKIIEEIINTFVEMELLTKTYINNLPYYQRTDGLVAYVDKLKEVPFPHKEIHWEFI